MHKHKCSHHKIQFPITTQLLNILLNNSHITQDISIMPKRFSSMHNNSFMLFTFLIHNHINHDLCNAQNRHNDSMHEVPVHP